MSEEITWVNDLCGSGEWSHQRVRERYVAYCQQLGVLEKANLSPRIHQEGHKQWIYPALDEMIAGIAAGDPACISLGVDLIEEDAHMTFGRLFKSNTARALRRTNLTEDQQERIRKRIVAMYLAGNIQREFREYNKLLRKVGVGRYREELDAGLPRENPYAVRFYELLTAEIRLPRKRKATAPNDARVAGE